ncbi:MAG: phosphate ABC transporter permease subunit PstC [Actinomycetota bacterium]|nr:phosphate ABC transporter permease subunit PstC [Actinomycetota bacterium]
MTTTAPTAQPDGGAGSPPLRRLGAALRGIFRGDGIIRWTGRIGAVVPLVMLGLILLVLIVRALPAIQFSGLKFITGRTWNFGSQYGTPVKSQGLTHEPGEVFGALPEILGTLVTSAIALVIAVPVAIGAAMVIVERLPRRLAYCVGLFLELLAGIPSVIVGLWGALTFGPFIAHDIAPIFSNTLGKIPGLGFFAGDTGNGQGLLTSGLILAVMIIPIIAATARDLIRGVPILPREGAIALGMSDWETARRVTLPWVGSGLIGAGVLGLARALGETIAVAMVCGVALGNLPANLYGAMTTIAANIVQNIDTAILDPLDIRAFAELALVLMVVTLATNVLARLLVRRVSGTALPVGRGL